MTSQVTLEQFYRSALGKYILDWEQDQCDKMVSDCFGFNAVQLGVSSQNFLRNNRIGFQLIAEENLQSLIVNRESCGSRSKIDLDFSALPFESESIDLVVLPHTLEVADDPYSVIREVARVLIPGGRVVITGFNLFSLLGFRVGLQKFGVEKFLPAKQFMSVANIKDWLNLLSFEVDRGRFGRYGSMFFRKPLKATHG